VDHALLVGVVQRVGQPRGHLGRLAEGRPAGGEQVGQRDPLDELADEVGGAVVLADLVNRDDGRAPQLGRAARGAQEAPGARPWARRRRAAA
jgi:hypothetical protein